VQGPRHATRKRIEFHADEAHSRRGMAQEIADATAGFQHQASIRYTQTSQGLEHGGDNYGGCVEGVKGAAPGADVIFRTKTCFKLLPELLPAFILVPVCYRVGEQGEGHRAKAGKTKKCLPLLW